MKPVHQTIFGNGEGPGAGNCVQAALASVLELDLDDVPHFVAMGDDWFERMQAWLCLNLGLQVIPWNLPEETPIADLWEPSGFTLLSGKSPRGDYNHCVVGRGFELVHDPHPSGDGLDGRPTEIEVFAVLDPADVAGRVSWLVKIARCPVHGLHGERTKCFVCEGPVEQVEMVPAHPSEPPVVGEELVGLLGKITPGPWRYVKDGEGSGWKLGYFENGAFLAIATFDQWDDSEQAHANVKFVSDAPEIVRRFLTHTENPSPVATDQEVEWVRHCALADYAENADEGADDYRAQNDEVQAKVCEGQAAIARQLLAIGGEGPREERLREALELVRWLWDFLGRDRYYAGEDIAARVAALQPPDPTEGPEHDYDANHADLTDCGYIGENLSGFVEQCIRREGHPGSHFGMGSDV